MIYTLSENIRNLGQVLQESMHMKFLKGRYEMKDRTNRLS